MNCPGCSGEMETSDVDGAQLHTCISCSGIWMSYSSISALMQLEGSYANPISLSSKLVSCATSNLKCPECADSKLRILNQTNVELDVCHECVGLFLDHGEMEKLVSGYRDSVEKEQPSAGFFVFKSVVRILFAFLSS